MSVRNKKNNPDTRAPLPASVELEQRLRSLGIEPSARYLREFAGKLFVVKSGGSLLEDPATGEGLLDDVALMARSGIRVALVHGGSVQADRDMVAAGIEPRRHRGLRVTCERTRDILAVCFGRLNRDIVNALLCRGVGARGFHAGEGGLLTARKLEVEGADLGFVGEVHRVNREALDALPAGTVAAVSAIAPDAAGELLNVNADYVAAQIALGARAAKLIFLSDVPGVLLDRGDPASLISTLTPSRADALIAGGVIERGMIPKIESAGRAVQAGLPKAHLLEGKRPHALLCEVFTEQGCGTQIVPDVEAP